MPTRQTTVVAQQYQWDGYMDSSCVIRQLLGTPFLYGGRDKRGMDCYGVVLAWWKAHGKELSDPLRVTESVEGCGVDVFHTNRGNEWVEVEGTFSEGDVVTFSRKNGTDLATHCGVYLRGSRVLHATERAGVVVTRLAHLKERMKRVYRPICRA
jgi:cell wall-associated NlpC family hydrolase